MGRAGRDRGKTERARGRQDVGPPHTLERQVPEAYGDSSPAAPQHFTPSTSRSLLLMQERKDVWRSHWSQHLLQADAPQVYSSLPADHRAHFRMSK